MAVTIHNTTLTSGPASAGARVLLHTATAGSCLLVWNLTNEANSLSAVAAAGVAMTRLGLVSAGTSTVELWGLTAPGSGVLTISAIGVGTQANLRGLIATSYVGQRQIGGSPFGTVVGGSASGTVTDFSVSSTTADLVAFGFGISANATITLGNGTERGNATLSTVGRLVVGDIAGAATVSLSASSSGTGIWGMIGVPIVASATAVTNIVFDNAAVTATTTSVNLQTLTITATPGACLIVFTNVGGGDQTISAIAANGLALTRKGFVDYQAAAAKRSELWVLTAAPSGVISISAIIADGAATSFGLGAVTYTGHKTDGDPFGGVDSSSFSSTAQASLVVSSTAGNVAVLFFGAGTTISSGPAINQRAVTGAFPQIIIADTPGLTSVTASATAGGATYWGNLGINLLQSTGLAVRNGSATFTDVADTLSAPGYVVVSGSIAATDATDALSALGYVIVRGSIAATDSTDTFSASGYALVRGSIAATDTVDTLSASGYVVVRGSINATDTTDTLAAVAAVRIVGLLNATDAADTATVTGYVIVSGSVTATDQPDTLVALAGEALSARSATIAATDLTDTLAATGTSDAATGSGAPAVVVTLDTSSLGGKPERRRKSKNAKPPYIQAPDTFWLARERYLESLKPEIDSEPEPQALPQPVTTQDSPPLSNPALLATYRLERQAVITTLPQAVNMTQLRAAGKRLVQINEQIAEQKRLQLVFQQLEQARIRRAEQRRQRLGEIHQMKRKALRLAAAQVALSLTHIMRNNNL